MSQDPKSLNIDRRFDYLLGYLIYEGANVKTTALASDEDWLIWKYEWADGNRTREVGPVKGSWDNRASLDWG